MQEFEIILKKNRSCFQILILKTDKIKLKNFFF